MTHTLTREERSRGGRRAASKPAPDDCAYCRERGFKTHAQHAGHLGWAGLVKKRFGGDEKSAWTWLSRNGLAAQDPFPENGAWQNPPEMPGGKPDGDSSS